MMFQCRDALINSVFPNLINCSFSFLGNEAGQTPYQKASHLDIPININDPMAPILLGNVERFKLLREYQIISEE